MLILTVDGTLLNVLYFSHNKRNNSFTNARKEVSTMTTTEIIKKVIELQELEDMLHELNAEIDSIKDSLKQALNEQHSEELIVGTHVIRYTTVISNRFNSTEFKKVMPEVYKAYLKPVTSKRFTVA